MTSQKVSFPIMYSGQSADRDPIRDVYIDNAYEGKYDGRANWSLRPTKNKDLWVEHCIIDPTVFTIDWEIKWDEIKRKQHGKLTIAQTAQKQLEKDIAEWQEEQREPFMKLHLQQDAHFTQEQLDRFNNLMKTMRDMFKDPVTREEFEFKKRDYELANLHKKWRTIYIRNRFRLNEDQKIVYRRELERIYNKYNCIGLKEEPWKIAQTIVEENVHNWINTYTFGEYLD